jgi:hypothetical protein
MDETTRDEDGWVTARLVALEQANRRLWLGIGTLLMTLISVALAGFLFVSSIELAPPIAGAAGGSIEATDLTLSGALRVVDESGRNLVWIGREPARPGDSAAPEQSMIGLFSAAGGETPLQTVRIATSQLGSALSLSTPDGAESVSAFAGDTGVTLELRRGEKAQVLSERSEGQLAASAPAATPAPAPSPALVAPQPEGKRAEAPATAARGSDAERGAALDLSDPTIQPLGADFYVGQLTLDDSRGTLRVSGRLINASSLDQLRAEFRLTVGGRELPFSVGRIPAGGSTAFTVELPSMDSAALRSARMRWVRSTLSYRTE